MKIIIKLSIDCVNNSLSLNFIYYINIKYINIILIKFIYIHISYETIE